MIATTAYILISTILSNNGTLTQSTATFAGKASCESAAVRQDFVFKSMRLDNELSSNPLQLKWNLTCHPYTLNGESK